MKNYSTLLAFMTLVARESGGRAQGTLLSRRQRQIGPGGDDGLGILREAWPGRAQMSNLKSGGGSRIW